MDLWKPHAQHLAFNYIQAILAILPVVLSQPQAQGHPD